MGLVVIRPKATSVQLDLPIGTELGNIPGILISGGWDVEKSVEVYSPSYHCVLPSLSGKMVYHTSNEGTMCGGYYTKTTCINFSSGKWVTSHALAEERSWHTILAGITRRRAR